MGSADTQGVAGLVNGQIIVLLCYYCCCNEFVLDLSIAYCFLDGIVPILIECIFNRPRIN